MLCYKLRTLLIVTTLIACALGVAVWMRQPSIRVVESVVDVGVVRPDTSGATSFEVRNLGWRPIKLARHCTVGRVHCEPARLTIPPGEALRWIVRWTSLREPSNS